jgi:hypothetical protein
MISDNNLSPLHGNKEKAVFDLGYRKATPRTLRHIICDYNRKYTAIMEA